MFPIFSLWVSLAEEDTHLPKGKESRAWMVKDNYARNTESEKETSEYDKENNRFLEKGKALSADWKKKKRLCLIRKDSKKGDLVEGRPYWSWEPPQHVGIRFNVCGETESVFQDIVGWMWGWK